MEGPGKLAIALNRSPVSVVNEIGTLAECRCPTRSMTAGTCPCALSLSGKIMGPGSKSLSPAALVRSSVQSCHLRLAPIYRSVVSPTPMLSSPQRAEVRA